MQSCEIKVSVIIPVYDVSEFLAECLVSVINQTMREIEIICIDDASTDNSMEILKYYKNLDDRIFVYSNEKNYGAAYTRNRGIQLAKGKFIYALDADDKIKPTALQKLYEIAEKNNSDVITFEGELLFQNEILEKKFKDNTIYRQHCYPQSAIGREYFSLFMNNSEWVASVPRHFYRREFIITNNLQFISGIIEEDEFFSFQVYLYAQNVCYIKESLFIRRVRENSVTTKEETEKTFIGKFVTFISRGDIPLLLT